MKLSEFDFELPEELIAQHPVEKRDTSRLMVVNRENGNIEHRHFYDILDYLKPGDVLVRNNTKVIPARLFGIKEETNGHVEVLLLKELKKDTWECLCGNARIIKMNTVITFGEGLLKAKCIEIKDEGIRVFEMMYDGIFYEILDQLGTMPLPPYIKEKLEDKNRYQTVYAKIEGSAAAPTAGLHFTEEINQKIKDKGIEILDVCLHVGLGTFRPVKEENVLKVDSFLNHQMDIHLFEQMGEEFKRRFKDKPINKILTIEASGIGIACIVAKYFDAPVVFAKKTKSINIEGEMYIAEVESFTHKCKNQVIVSKKFLSPDDHVLIIDDFLANGCALQGLISIVLESGASVEGIGIAIEKGFQSGGRIIRNLGYHLESLAIVDSMDASNSTIVFHEQ